MQKHIQSNDGTPAQSLTVKFLKQADAARVLGVSENTLRKWDCPRIIIGKNRDGRTRRVRYDIAKVQEWLEQNQSI